MKSKQRTAIHIHGSASEHWTSLIAEHFSNVDIIDRQQLDASTTHQASVEALIGWKFPPALFAKLPELRWIQFISADVNEIGDNPLISPDVIVTNTKGLYSDSVADYVLWSLLTLTRKFDEVTRNQFKRRWVQISGPTLRNKKVGILGVGNVGGAVAQRARAFEMETVGIVPDKTESADLSCVDVTLPQRELHRVVGELDALVICVPATSATRGIIDAELIAKMKPGAYLINISRGGVADEMAIAAALEEGRLAGASMDCFEKEPLRRWSSLWKTRNLLVTPHISGITDDYQERVGELICENVRRFSAGESLLNVVDRNKGY